MNFLFLNQYQPPDPSPTARLLGDLAEALRRDGHNVEIVSQRQHYFDRPVRGFRRLCRELWALLRMAHEGLWPLNKPDIVVALSSPPGLLPIAALLARKHGARLAHWAMDLYPELALVLGEIRPGVVTAFAKKAMTWGYHETALIVALDEDMAAHLQHTYLVHARVLTPWPARLRTGQGSGAGEQNSPGAELAAGIWTWLYSGNLGRAHEWRPILDVQAELERRELPVQLLFEGGGAAWAEARAYAEALRLRSCQWTGYVSEDASFQTLRASKLIVATQRPNARGLLWPSKLARVLPLTKPLLWIGPTDGAIARSIRNRPFTGCFEPHNIGKIADWVHQLWQSHSHAHVQESVEQVQQIYTAATERNCRTLASWLTVL